MSQDFTPCINNVRAKLTRDELLQQLAEESSELTKAALKLIRAERCNNKNWTPTTMLDATHNLVEEINDVIMVIQALGYKVKDQSSNPKWKRWSDRLDEHCAQYEYGVEPARDGWFIREETITYGK